MSDVSRWLTWRDSQTFERKSCYDKSKTPSERLNARVVSEFIAETLSAMANADGGVLLVGQGNLRENGEDGGGEITGVDYNAGSLDLLRNAPRRLVVPPLDIATVEVHQEQSKTLLLFHVPSSLCAHHLTDGRCLLRVDKHNAPYDCGVVAQLKQSQSPFERRPVPEATLNDLDSDALTWFAERVNWRGDVAGLLDEYDLLLNGQLSRAAVLLFARKPSRWLSHTDVTFVHYVGKERGVGVNYNATPPLRLVKPLVRLIEFAYTEIGERLPKQAQLDNLFFENRSHYPTFAWQEAIVNAIAHRDYALDGVGIEVWLFDDRLVIRSPGRLLAPLSIEALLAEESLRSGVGKHYSRNPLVTRVLIDAGYMREQGEGIPRMFQVMEAADLRPPELALQDFLFLVTLYSTPVYDNPTRQWLQQFERLNLSREQRRVLAFARSRTMRFTNRDLQKHFGLDPYTASHLIRSLMRKNLIRLPERRGRVYEVVATGEMETLPEDLQALFPAFQQREHLGSREIKAVWKLSYYQTYRRIRALVEAGWLADTNAQGRMATYELTERGKKAMQRR